LKNAHYFCWLALKSNVLRDRADIFVDDVDARSRVRVAKMLIAEAIAIQSKPTELEQILEARLPIDRLPSGGTSVKKAHGFDSSTKTS
jgi:hypothetical protein